MSTLDELRRTLDEHADSLHDDGAHVRAAAVRRRGRQVRRQRRIGVAVAAAAVVATTAAVVTLPGGDSPQPADRHLLGMEAPASLQSLGYTYDFARGVVGDADRTVVRLAASDQPRLLSWADKGVDTIRVRTADDRVIASHGDFEDFTIIPPGQSGTWTITGANTAAAIYTLDTTRPPDGATQDGITYRSRVLDRRLIGAQVGQVGESSVRSTIQLPAGRIGFSSYCTGGDENTWFHVEIQGATSSFGANCTAPVFDPGGNLETQFRWKTAGPTQVHAWATEGEHGPVLDHRPVRITFGFYSMGHDTIEVAGTDMDQQVEYDGHVWAIPLPVESRPGDRELRTAGPGLGVPFLVVAAFSHTGGPVYTSLAGVPGAAFSGTQLGGSATLGTTDPGSPPSSLRIRGTVSPRAVLGFAFYQRIG